MKRSLRTAISMAIAGTIAAPALIHADSGPRSIPSVIVTAENSAPARGALQTPVWVAAHDGTFDIYDRNVPLGSGSLISAASVESLAEDGSTAAISAEFSSLLPYAPQDTLLGASGPLEPGGSSSTTFNVNPESDRFFSYASMVIPSNDAFIANGSPVAHPLFNENGRFIAEDFVVTGAEVLDAGTEVNDEVASVTAFLNQGGPNLGDDENGSVVIHPGFRTDLTFPDGVLNHPVFANADFTAPTYRAASFSFRYIDLGQRQRILSSLNPANEVTGAEVESNAGGRLFAIARRGEQISIRVVTNGLTGPATMAHLHNAAAGVNGPVVVNLTGSLERGRRLQTVIRAEDVLGSLAQTADPMVSLLNEIAAGNIYVNVHTEANPGGEVRGQLAIR